MPVAAAIAAEFDPDFYLAANPDVLKAGVDPLHHFVKHGWKEGRNPNSSFSVHAYLHLYPDVKEAGVNPFWHYVVAGRREGRTLEQRQSLDLQAVLTSRPIRDREASTEDNGHAVSDATGLVERLSRHPLIVSVSHDDYTRSVGGIQNCINMEAQAAAEAGIDYLHLYPRTSRSWLVPSGGLECLCQGRLRRFKACGAFVARTQPSMALRSFPAMYRECAGVLDPRSHSDLSFLHAPEKRRCLLRWACAELAPMRPVCLWRGAEGRARRPNFDLAGADRPNCRFSIRILTPVF